MPVTLVTLFRSYNQFYRAECITILGFFIHQCLPVIEQRCSCTLHTTNVFFLRHRKCIFNAPVPTRFDNIGVFLLFRYHKYILMHQYLPGFIHQVYSSILDTYICYLDAANVLWIHQYLQGLIHQVYPCISDTKNVKTYLYVL